MGDRVNVGMYGRKMAAWFGETFYWTATVIAGLLLAWALWGYAFNRTILIVPLLLSAVIWLTAWACRKVLK
jgi:ABC-type sugar transport system permease subunit